MYLYNVTIKVDWKIAEEWVEWMKQIHIPSVMDTGCFEKHVMVQLLETDETDGQTYAVQYFAESLSKYENYIEHYAPFLREQTITKWGGKFIAFRSLMKVVS